MAGKTFETEVRFGSSIDESWNKALDKLADTLDKIQKEVEESGDVYESMAKTISAQSKTLKAAERAYASYAMTGQETSEKAQELAEEIQKLSGELGENKTRFANAKKAAESITSGMDKAEESIDDVTDAARDSEGGFTIMKGAISGLLANGISRLIDGATNAVSSIYGLAESTREFRQDMGTLETAFNSANLSAEAANDTWLDLYSVFGEDDRAVEAANNIARMSKNQQDLDQWVKITTGIWGTYQDALPVEGLAEAAGETAKVGQVTGVMADALNWSTEAAEMFADYMSNDVTTAEDAFNAALSECTSEQERQALITETLTKLYGDAAEKYEATAGSVMDANRATGELAQSQADLGERIEPVTTAATGGFQKILDKVLELTDGVDFQAFAGKISSAFDTVAGFIDKATTAISNTKETIQSSIPIVTGLVGGFAAYKAVLLGVSAAQKVKAALDVAQLVMTGQLTVANTALGAAIAAVNWPILLAAAAIGALIAAGVGLYKNWDTVKEKAKQLADFLGDKWDWIKNGVGNMVGGIKQFFVDGFSSLAGIVKGPINAVIGIVNGAINGINSIGFDVPDWVPVIGGKRFALSIPNIPMLAKGGFTNGVSIAGEAGTEAVISFDQRYRRDNLTYWQKAGRMLGANATDFPLSGNYNDSKFDIGSISFAPNIHVNGGSGNTKAEVLAALEEAFPEFMDMLDRWVEEREAATYG